MELQNAGLDFEDMQGTCFANGIDWTIMEDDFWMIGGLHHSGKTTLTLLASGLLRPSFGRALLQGVDVIEGSDREYRRAREETAVVFEQGGRLFQQATIFDNVAMPLRYQGAMGEPEIEERTLALLDMVGLHPKRNTTPSMISRNLQQRAALARSLALCPDLIFFDNCLAGLDGREKSWWRETILHLHQGHPLLNDKPAAIVVTTADLDHWRFPDLKFALIDASGFTTYENIKEMLETCPSHLKELLHPRGN